MIPKTPQKKKSEGQDRRNQMPNHSYVIANSNHPSQQHSPIRGKAEESFLKNSQVMLPKKPAKGGFAKKYAHQDNIFKQKNHAPVKEYREVVVSDQFVKSHKLYKMLKEQVAITDARHMRESTQLTNTLNQEQNQTRDIRTKNHQLKLQLWELRNQLIELKALHEEEEEQNKRLAEQYDGQYDEQQEIMEPEEGEQGESSPQEQEQKEKEIVSELLSNAKFPELDSLDQPKLQQNPDEEKGEQNDEILPA